MKFQILKNDYITLKHPTVIYKMVRLYRIIAMRDFGNVKDGQVGGYVESESNLDGDDKSWIYNEAKVFDTAVITNDSAIRDKAIVCGKSQIKNSTIGGYALVTGNDTVVDGCVIADRATVKNGLVIETDMFNAAAISLSASGHVRNSKLHGGSYISGNSQVTKSTLRDYCRVYDSQVTGCELSQGALLRDKKILNETISTNIDLKVESYAE